MGCTLNPYFEGGDTDAMVEDDAFINVPPLFLSLYLFLSPCYVLGVYSSPSRVSRVMSSPDTKAMVKNDAFCNLASPFFFRLHQAGNSVARASQFAARFIVDDAFSVYCSRLSFIPF